MSFVPENQCHTWLKEVSTLARFLKNYPEFQNLESTTDLTAGLIEVEGR
jgi:hypothetical protein